ncbi:MAG: N-acetylmuramoyl-L-alanine amidase [Bacteroidales bacterium]|nr:N-acetylmuramoyl-L-alanine amidase [Bacteroidales bacterium]
MLGILCVSKYALRIIVFSALIQSVAFHLTASVDQKKIETVVIDAGHGGKDPGALGEHVTEKEIVLSIALKLGKYIEEGIDDVKVIYTRTEDVFVPLHERAEIANKNKADLFISIHANANDSKTVSGTETYTMGLHKSQDNLEVAKLENSVIYLEEDYSANYEGFDPSSPESYIIFSLLQNIHMDQSLGFASYVQEQFRERALRKDRGVKQAGFLVLWQTSMPSILIETGFVTNSKEEEYLSSSTGQDYLASAIYRAFKDYKQAIETKSAFENIEVPQASEVPVAKSAPENDSLYFKVQVVASGMAIPLSSSYFSSFGKVEEFLMQASTNTPWERKNLTKGRQDMPGM